MSISLIQAVFRIDEDLTGLEKYVLIGLASFASEKGRRYEIYPSLAILSKRLNVTERIIKDQTASLSKKYFITKKRKGKGNQYFFNFEKIKVGPTHLVMGGSSHSINCMSKLVIS